MPKTKKPKAFVLDTSVLIHDPLSVHQFEENNVYLPGEVLEELDRFKTEQSSRGRRARQVHRILNGMFPDEKAMLEGHQKAAGGEIQMIFNAYMHKEIKNCERWKKLKDLFYDMGKTDNRILACAIYIAETYRLRTIVVSKDINMQLKARMLSMDSQDYLTDKVKDDDEILASNHKKVFLSTHEMQRFASSGEVTIKPKAAKKIIPSSYLLVEDPRGKTMPAKYLGNETLQRVNGGDQALLIKGAPRIRARNLGQQFFIDALLDPEIKLITVYGKAGTGKTFLGIAAALQQIQENFYSKVVVTRAIIPMGRDIGFLPGDKEEKMQPWVQPIYDNIEAIMRPQPAGAFEGKVQRKKPKKAKGESGSAPGNGHPPMKPHEKLMAAGILEVEALAHVRGRSIPSVFFIVDEAQQLSPHEAKTIVTRMGEGSKLVLMGDPAQIDNPYVDMYSNGLVYARKCFKGQGIAAHVNLIKGERSLLSELGANLM